MATPTGYLFGDSTPSPLKTDFVAFLRDAFDFAVQVLLCDHRLADATARVDRLSEVTEREIERAELLSADVARALDAALAAPPDSLAARCALRIRQGAKDLIQAEADGARTAVTTERVRAAQAMANDRDAVVKAFEALVLRHTLPDSDGAIHVALEASGGYGAQLRAGTPYGLEWVMTLEIPSSHSLAQVLRIDRVVERLEVDAPEEGGWIHKEVRIRPQRFDRLHLAELALDRGGTTIKLRAAADGTGGGFDVIFTRGAAGADLVRVLEGGPSTDSPFQIVGDDFAKLQSLHDSLATMARELGEHKKALRGATLERTSLEVLEAPRVVVERIIANIAPIVQEIAKRSLVPGELVLKRVLGDNHRDEVFLSKKELEGKLEGLPPALRRTFDPLGLWSASSEAPKSPARAPEPAPVPAPATHASPVQPPVASTRPQVTPMPTVMVAPDPPPAAEPPTAAAPQGTSQAPRPSARPPRP